MNSIAIIILAVTFIYGMTRWIMGAPVVKVVQKSAINSSYVPMTRREDGVWTKEEK